MNLQDFKERHPVTPTRFIDADNDCKLYITKIAPSVWQCLVEQGGSVNATGAQSKTKMEAFSVLPSVAEAWGFTV